MWSKAVMYPGKLTHGKLLRILVRADDSKGEKGYHDNYQMSFTFVTNPYRFKVVSPYGYWQNQTWGPPRPRADYHARSIHQTIDLNNQLNREAQASIDAKEPKMNIWDDDQLDTSMSKMSISNGDQKRLSEKAPIEKRQSLAPFSTNGDDGPAKVSRFASFRKSMGIKSSEERSTTKLTKKINQSPDLRDSILAEEAGRWQDDSTRQIVAAYQGKVGMSGKIAHLRAKQPIQYLHLLRAGYFEPVPVAWAGSASNPLKFSIEAVSGWRGITPAWRGYEDTAEERLYWVLNHREGTVAARMKPDFISAMDMARARMASAVEPPPQYFSSDDTCHLQHTSSAYSKQVMPSPFRAYDRPELPTDDTMILLDVSGSMDFDPIRPNYNQYLITGYSRSTQPKNKGEPK